MVREIRDIVAAKEMEKAIKPSKEALLELARHQVGSINLRDIVDADLLTGESKAQYLANAELVWVNPVFKNELYRIIRKQLEFIAMQSSDFDQTLVGRGTINGADLIRERFETLHIQYADRNKPKEKFDKFEISA